MRVWELETYGALFDRTPDGKISQRNFGGHEYPRLAHVGDRTGLELIRTLQQKIVSLQQEDQRETGDYESRLRVFAELTVTDILKDGGAVSGAFGYWRESGRFVALRRAGGHPGDRRHRQVLQGHQQLLGVHRRRPRAGPARRRDADQHGVHPVPPDGHGLAAVGEGHPRHRVGARRRGSAAQLARASGSCSTTSPTCSAASTPTPRRRPTAGTRTRTTTSARPELLPRDEVARAINNEVKEGRGSPHGGVFLDVSTRLPADEIIRRLPSMHHQFKELADVDITAEPMEVGPTCHYVMGGVEVDADTAATCVPGLFAAGEVAGGMHGSNRLGGNSLSDLLVFGRRAGAGAAEYVAGTGGFASGDQRRRRRRGRRDGPARRSTAATASENPYTLHPELQQKMNDLVGIIRREGEVARGARHARRPRRAREIRWGGRAPAVQPGLAPRARPAQHARRLPSASRWPRWSAPSRRGGHTREDFPAMDPQWRGVNLVCTLDATAASQLERASRSPRSARTCSSCSSAPSCPSTSPSRADALRRGRLRPAGQREGATGHELRREVPGVARGRRGRRAARTTPSR